MSAYNTHSPMSLGHDYAEVHKMRCEGKTLKQIINVACKNVRSAKRAHLDTKRDRKTITRWYQASKQGRTFAECYGPTPPKPKYSKEHKTLYAYAYKHANNRAKGLLSYRKYCAQRAHESIPGLNKSNLQQWCKELGIRNYKPGKVPAYLQETTIEARLQFADCNQKRLWQYTAGSDEFFVDSSETLALLNSRINFKAFQSDKDERPQVARTKFPGIKIGSFIIIDYRFANLYKDMVLLKIANPESMGRERNHRYVYDNLRHGDHWPTEWLNEVFVGDELTKRRWRKRVPVESDSDSDIAEEKRQGDALPRYATMDATTFIKECVPLMHAWRDFKFEQEAALVDREADAIPSEISKRIWLFHDNAKYYIAKATQDELKRMGVPVYPPGHLDGYNRGFPPRSPDMNCVVEYAAGYIKIRTAEQIYALSASERNRLNDGMIARFMRVAFSEIDGPMVESWVRALRVHITQCVQTRGKYGSTVRSGKLTGEPARKMARQLNLYPQRDVRIP